MTKPVPLMVCALLILAATVRWRAVLTALGLCLLQRAVRRLCVTLHRIDYRLLRCQCARRRRCSSIASRRLWRPSRRGWFIKPGRREHQLHPAAARSQECLVDDPTSSDSFNVGSVRAARLSHWRRFSKS